MPTQDRFAPAGSHPFQTDVLQLRHMPDMLRINQTVWARCISHMISPMVVLFFLCRVLVADSISRSG